MNRRCTGIWIPIELWETTELKVMEKLFLVEIDSLDNEEGCYANNDHFSKFFNLSKNRCSEIINTLKKKGYIDISYKYKGNSREIEKRIIKVTNKYLCIRYSEGGAFGKSGGGPSENTKDNNTIINNTINNNNIEKPITDSIDTQEQQTIIQTETDTNINPVDTTSKRKDTKHIYGEYKNVRLTDTELERLTAEFGKQVIDNYITRLDEYIENTGKKYKNHNLTIRQWLRKSNITSLKAKIDCNSEQKALQSKTENSTGTNDLLDDVLARYNKAKK